MQGDWGRACRPQWTMVRFSPVMLITSATVPMAARVPVAPEGILRPLRPRQSHGQLQRHAHAGQVFEGIGAVRPVGIHHGGGLRKRLAALMVVGDYQIQADVPAKSASATPVMPQSTVTISAAPSARSFSSAGVLRP